jgi:hypothetical protein
MGAATKGGGAAAKGPKNKMMKETSKTTGPVMMAKGGMASKGYAAGGMATKGYAAGGAAMKSKGAAAGGAMKKKKSGK